MSILGGKKVTENQMMVTDVFMMHYVCLFCTYIIKSLEESALEDNKAQWKREAKMRGREAVNLFVTGRESVLVHITLFTSDDDVTS